MARPKKQIDPDQVRKLAGINCSYAEIAAVLGCDESTLTRRFAQVIKEGRELGKSSLKRMMWEACQKGNTALMIFLSKQMLGYSDKIEQTNEHTGEIALRSLSEAEILERKEKVMERLQKRLSGSS